MTPCRSTPSGRGQLRRCALLLAVAWSLGATGCVEDTETPDTGTTEQALKPAITPLTQAEVDAIFQAIDLPENAHLAPSDDVLTAMIRHAPHVVPSGSALRRATCAIDWQLHRVGLATNGTPAKELDRQRADHLIDCMEKEAPSDSGDDGGGIAMAASSTSWPPMATWDTTVPIFRYLIRLKQGPTYEFRLDELSDFGRPQMHLFHVGSDLSALEDGGWSLDDEVRSGVVLEEETVLTAHELPAEYGANDWYLLVIHGVTEWDAGTGKLWVNNRPVCLQSPSPCPDEYVAYGGHTRRMPTQHNTGTQFRTMLEPLPDATATPSTSALLHQMLVVDAPEGTACGYRERTWPELGGVVWDHSADSSCGPPANVGDGLYVIASDAVAPYGRMSVVDNSGPDADNDGVGDLLEAHLGMCSDSSTVIERYVVPPGEEEGYNWTWDCADSVLSDTDIDGLPDAVELFGVDDPAVDGDERQRMRLWGADPLHKDVFVEVDYDQAIVQSLGTQPISSLLNAEWVGNLHAYFAEGTASEYGNPSGLDGLRLHAELPDTPVTSLESNPVLTFNAGYAGYTPVPCARTGSSSRAVSGGLGRTHFRYQCTGNGDGGAALASATYFCTSAVANAAHELGHALGLGHGGGDDFNFKVNYISLMSYEAPWIDSRPDVFPALAFSAEAGPTLDPESLCEADGATEDVYSAFVDSELGSPFAYRTAHGGVDWNRDGVISPCSQPVRDQLSAACDTRTDAVALPDAIDSLAIAVVRSPDERIIVLASTSAREVFYMSWPIIEDHFGPALGPFLFDDSLQADSVAIAMTHYGPVAAGNDGGQLWVASTSFVQPGVLALTDVDLDVLEGQYIGVQKPALVDVDDALLLAIATDSGGIVVTVGRLDEGWESAMLLDEHDAPVKSSGNLALVLDGSGELSLVHQTQADYPAVVERRQLDLPRSYLVDELPVTIRADASRLASSIAPFWAPDGREGSWTYLVSTTNNQVYRYEYDTGQGETIRQPYCTNVFGAGQIHRRVATAFNPGEQHAWGVVSYAVNGTARVKPVRSPETGPHPIVGYNDYEIMGHGHPALEWYSGRDVDGDGQADFAGVPGSGICAGLARQSENDQQSCLPGLTGTGASGGGLPFAEHYSDCEGASQWQ